MAQKIFIKKNITTFCFFIFIVLIFASQLFFDSTSLPIGYESLKVKIIFFTAIFALLIIFLHFLYKFFLFFATKNYKYKILKKIFIKSKKNYFQYILLLFSLISFFIIIISTFKAYYFDNSYLELLFYGSRFRFLGLFSIIMLFIIFTFIFIFYKKIYFLLIINLFLFFGFIQGIFGFKDFFDYSFQIIIKGYHVNGNFGQANFFADTMISMSLISFLLIIYSKNIYKKIIYFFLFLFFSINIFFSFSEAAIIMFLLLFIMLSLYLIIKKIFLYYKYSFLKIKISLIIIYIFIFFIINYLIFLFERSRHDYWNVIFELIKIKPLFGYGGLDTMGYLFKNQNLLNNRFVDRSHNFLIDILYSYGFIFLYSVLFPIIYLFYKKINMFYKTISKQIQKKFFISKTFIIFIPIMVFLFTGSVHTKSIYHYAEFLVFYAMFLSSFIDENLL